VTSRYRLIETGFDPATTGALQPDENAFRIRDRLTDNEYRHLAGILAQRPDAWLWLEDRSPDIECLAHFPGLRRLMVPSLRLESWAGLRHVAASLEDLGMGDGTLKRISIAPMADLSPMTASDRRPAVWPSGLAGVMERQVAERLDDTTE